MSNRRDGAAPSPGPHKVRALTRADLPQIADHYLRLDTETRRDRFGASVTDSDIVAYVQRLPIERGVIAGCFPDKTLRGLIEARPVSGESCHWECVVSVEPEWKRKGLGRKLTESTFASARTSGASRMYLRCSVSNAPGQHFMACFARQLREEDGDAVAAVDLSDQANAAIVSMAQFRAAGRDTGGASKRAGSRD